MIEETVVEEVVTEAPEKAKKAKKTKKVEEAPKEEKKAKKTKKVEEPVKPTRIEATAKSLNVRSTPRKIRLVLDLIRGKNVLEAMNILNNTNKIAAVPVMKLIRSAYANATNNFGMNGEKLYVYEIYAGDGMKMKRFMPRAKGSASSITKRMSHIYVTLRERGE